MSALTVEREYVIRKQLEKQRVAAARYLELHQPAPIAVMAYADDVDLLLGEIDQLRLARREQEATLERVREQRDDIRAHNRHIQAELERLRARVEWLERTARQLLEAADVLRRGLVVLGEESSDLGALQKQLYQLREALGQSQE